VIGFEDLPNLGDHAFNDAVFAFDFSSVGATVVVPEPGAMSLVAIGLVGLSGAGLVRRRTRIQR
jgi:hypothetical protein